MTVKNDEPEVRAGFMQRWSSRKIASQTETSNESEKEYLTKTDSANETVNDSSIEKPEVQDFKTDDDMPPLEELTADSNYSDFLSPKVSDALRKQALRKLFHLPFLNVVDELDDYAEDYTKFAALGDIIPHDMKRMLEREKNKELEEQEQQTLDSATELNANESQDSEPEDENLEKDTIVDELNESSENLQLSDVKTDDQESTPNDELINLKDRKI